MTKNATKNRQSHKAHGPMAADAVREPLFASDPLPLNVPAESQWYELHSFAGENSRDAENGSGNRDLIFADLEEQVRPLKMDRKVAGVEVPETDSDRKVTTNALVGPMLGGWDSVQIGQVECLQPTDEQYARCILERRQLLDQWRTKGEKEVVWVKAANYVQPFWFPLGIDVDYTPLRAIVNMCNRRTQSLPAVVYARHVRGIGLPGDYVVPVKRMEYATELDSVMRHIDENLGKDLGRQKYEPKEWLIIALKIDRAGGNEATLRKYGNVGEAQRCFRFLKLDKMFPDLNLVKRALAPLPALAEGETAYPYKAGQSPIPYKRLDKEALQALLQNKQLFATAEEGEPVTLKKGSLDERAKVLATADSVEAYMEYVTLSGKRAGNGWNKNHTKALSESPDQLLRFFGIAMSQGNAEVFAEFVAENRKAIDELLKATDIKAWQARALSKTAALPKATE